MPRKFDPGGGLLCDRSRGYRAHSREPRRPTFDREPVRPSQIDLASESVHRRAVYVDGPDRRWESESLINFLANWASLDRFGTVGWSYERNSNHPKPVPRQPDDPQRRIDVYPRTRVRRSYSHRLHRRRTRLPGRSRPSRSTRPCSHLIVIESLPNWSFLDRFGTLDLSYNRERKLKMSESYFDENGMEVIDCPDCGTALSVNSDDDCPLCGYSFEIED